MDTLHIIVTAIASLVSTLCGIFFYKRYSIRKSSETKLAEINSSASQGDRQMTLAEMQYIIGILKKERDECDKKYEKLLEMYLGQERDINELKMELSKVQVELEKYKNDH